MYFNVIVIRWGATCSTSCIRRIAVCLGSFTCFLTLSDDTFLPACATSCCGRSLLCVFSIWNANCFINFQFYSTGFNNFQFNSTGFNNFQFYSTGFNSFQFYSTGFITTLYFELGLPFLCPFLWDSFTRSVPAIHAILLLPFPYTCATFLCNLILFPLTKLYDILRGNSHWPYYLTKYFTFTIV